MSETGTLFESLRIGYADPPYPGQAKLYKEHADYAGEVDHTELIYRLVTEYDGYCLGNYPLTGGRLRIEWQAGDSACIPFCRRDQL